jgi:hypothetical protein
LDLIGAALEAESHSLIQLRKPQMDVASIETVGFLSLRAKFLGARSEQLRLIVSMLHVGSLGE